MRPRNASAERIKGRSRIRFRAAYLVWLAAPVLIYLLLPYILPIFGAKCFVIVSSSMVHRPGSQETFEEFWSQQGVTDPQYRGGIKPGDVVIFDDEQPKPGNVILYRRVNSTERVTHRLAAINGTKFRDSADHCVYPGNIRNDTSGVPQDPCASKWTPTAQIEGRAKLLLPKAGLLHLGIRCLADSDFCAAIGKAR